MNASLIYVQHEREHHAAKSEGSMIPQMADQRSQPDDAGSTPQDVPFKDHGTASNDHQDASMDIARSLDQFNHTAKGKEPVTRRGFFGRLKKLEEKLIGTKEERARQQANMEKVKEEDRKRQELAYQKQKKIQQNFYAEREDKQRQGRRPEYPEGPEELNVFLNWP